MSVRPSEYHVANDAHIILCKGHWKPIFKYRLAREYVHKRTNERDLFNELFDGHNQAFVITENRFPYVLEANITQQIIWFRNDELNQVDEAFLQSAFVELWSTHDFFVYVNHPQHRSIKTIPHMHVLYKRQEASATLVSLFCVCQNKYDTHLLNIYLSNLYDVKHLQWQVSNEPMNNIEEIYKLFSTTSGFNVLKIHAWQGVELTHFLLRKYMPHYKYPLLFRDIRLESWSNGQKRLFIHNFLLAVFD